MTLSGQRFANGNPHMRRSHHPRGRYALLLGLLACAPSAPTTWPNELGQRPPNILLVNLDDAGYGDLAANEGSRLGNNTPNFDRLANESLRLTDFHAAASVCSPSRASLLTGRWAIRFGMTRAIMHGDKEPSLPHTEQTIAEALKTAGYATAMAGKWHLGNGDSNHPSTHGFDEALTVPWTTDEACAEPWPCRYDRAVFAHGTLSAGTPQTRREYTTALERMCRIGIQPAAGMKNPKNWFKRKNDLETNALCPPRSLAHCGGRGAARAYSTPQWNAKNVKESVDRFERIARSDGIPGTHALSTALTWTNASCSGLDSCAPLTVEQPAAPWRLDEKYAAFFDGYARRVASAQSHPPSDAQCAAGLAARPFFFYLAPIQPHGPWLPAPRWQRRPSDLNDRKIPFAGYLDTMAEVDEMMGGVPRRVKRQNRDVTLNRRLRLFEA